MADRHDYIYIAFLGWANDMVIDMLCKANKTFLI